MATYRIKRFSYQPKRRKLFGLGDMAQGAIDTTRNVVGSTVAGTGNMISAAAPVVGAGTGLLSASTLGSAIAPITGTMGALGGAATGMGFGLLGGIPGVIAGGILGGIGGGVKGIYDGYKTTAKVGYNLGNSAIQLL